MAAVARAYEPTSSTLNLGQLPCAELPEHMAQQLQVVLRMKHFLSPAGLFCGTCPDAVPSQTHRAIEIRGLPACLRRQVACSDLTTAKAVLELLERADIERVVNKNVVAKQLAQLAVREGNVPILALLIRRGFPININLVSGRGANPCYLLDCVRVGPQINAYRAAQVYSDQVAQVNADQAAQTQVVQRAKAVTLVLLDAGVVVSPVFIDMVRQGAFCGGVDAPVARERIKKIWQLLHEHARSRALFEKEEKLFDAIERADMGEVGYRFSTQQVKPNARDVMGNTPLMRAVQHIDRTSPDAPAMEQVVQAILVQCSRGDLALRDAAGHTAQEIALAQGKPEIATLIAARIEQEQARERAQAVQAQQEAPAPAG
jgi:hypothetical protein